MHRTRKLFRESMRRIFHSTYENSIPSHEIVSSRMLSASKKLDVAGRMRKFMQMRLVLRLRAGNDKMSIAAIARILNLSPHKIRNLLGLARVYPPYHPLRIHPRLAAKKLGITVEELNALIGGEKVLRKSRKKK